MFDRCLNVLGTVVRVRATAPGLERALADLLDRFAVPDVEVPAGRCLVLNAADDLDRLLADLNVLALAGYRGFAVHAGAVAVGGEVVAFPAPSGAGKTTLVAACLGAGFDYLSDEALCVEYGTGRVVAYPRALTLSAWANAAVGFPGRPGSGPEVQVSPQALGATVAGGDLRLAHVVQLDRRDPVTATLEPLHPSTAVEMLLGLSFNHFRSPTDAFDLVVDLARAARSWRLVYGDPVEAARLLFDRFGAPSSRATASRKAARLPAPPAS